ncbi:MAG: hypothetical protein KJ936_06650 [Proteobacteria bacterium]|nr:hypothetical protein [Pseudomonadota bacterium]
MDPWYKIATPCKELGEGRISRIKADQDRGPDFLCLAIAPSALYPIVSEEKRLLDAMLLAVPR